MVAAGWLPALLAGKLDGDALVNLAPANQAAGCEQTATNQTQ
jgi:hypothetical protein